MKTCIVLFGVCGCGKSTIGKLLSEEMKIPFFDADDFHPTENKKKMKNGISLDDTDRKPWLFSISKFITNFEKSENLIFACSALKRVYREWISQDVTCRFIYIHLKGSFELIQKRLQERTNHFMNPKLLSSQFETLEDLNQEELKNSFEIDISKPIDEIIQQIKMNVENFNDD
eukprot:gene11767-5105_t